MTSGTLLVAAGGLAREALSALRAAGEDVAGMLDDDPALCDASFSGVAVVGAIEAAAQFPKASFVVCAGKPRSREAIVSRLGALGVGAGRYRTVIHPSVTVPESCTIGPGSIILAGCVLTTDVTVGRHVVLMPNVVLTHDDVLGDYATLTAGVLLGGGTRVGARAYLGMGSSVREKVSVGDDAVLGMGAVLLVDQPAGSVWAGVPAHGLRE